MEFDKEWRDLTNFFKFTPLRVWMLPQHSIHRYLSAQEGQPRIDRVNVRQENPEKPLITSQSG